VGGPDLALGTVLDGIYRIDRLVGQGGMGSVYEATQTRLDKRVAIKVMSRDLAGNPEALLRFRREAQVTSQLGHPNIVHVFDFGTTPEGAPFMAMELLEGEDLETRLQRVRRLPPITVASIVKQVASALSATHARGIVHRDLKPANVFLLNLEGSPDFVKVVDFGISKVRSTTGRLTRPAMLMGSPQFMSPEQASGQVDAIDHRTDQWALACIAFEALTGRAAFVGDDVAALLYQVIHSPPPSLTAVAPDLPGPMEVVLTRALAKSPDQRHENVGAFAAAFERAVKASGYRTKAEAAVRDDAGPIRTLMDGAPAVKDWAAETAYPAQGQAAVAPGPAIAVHGARGTAAIPGGSLGVAQSLAPKPPPQAETSGAVAPALEPVPSSSVSASMPAAKSKRAEATERAASALLASLSLPAVTDGPDVASEPGAALPGASGERGPQVTTLSRSVGELTPPGAFAVGRSRARTVVWLAAGAACLSLLAFLMINPRGAQTPPKDMKRELAAGQPARPPLPDRPALAAPAAAPTGPVIEQLDGTSAPKPAAAPAPPPRRAPATRPNTIADPAAPVQKQPSPAPSRRKPKLFEEL
jgi:tRNA A-37 threonylcarbamoyl transferase component Bud32